MIGAARAVSDVLMYQPDFVGIAILLKWKPPALQYSTEK